MHLSIFSRLPLKLGKVAAEGEQVVDHEVLVLMPDSLVFVEQVPEQELEVELISSSFAAILNSNSFDN
jgi:hypothetical protein